MLFLGFFFACVGEDFPGGLKVVGCGFAGESAIDFVGGQVAAGFGVAGLGLDDSVVGEFEHVDDHVVGVSVDDAEPEECGFDAQTGLGEEFAFGGFKNGFCGMHVEADACVGKAGKGFAVFGALDEECFFFFVLDEDDAEAVEEFALVHLG